MLKAQFIKKYTGLLAGLALAALLAAGCAGEAASDEEVVTRQLGSIPMSNATIYEADGTTTVVDTLAGTLHILPCASVGPDVTVYPVAGSVSGGKITLALPEIAEAQLWDFSDHERITVTPNGTKVFPGLAFALVAGSESLGQIVYGNLTDAIAAGFLYSGGGPVSIASDFFDIESAPNGWSIVTSYDERYSNSDSRQLPGDSVWLYLPGE